MSDEYKSDFTDKINNINMESLSEKQREINKLLNRKEKELNFEMDKFKNEVKNNKKIISILTIFFMLLSGAILFLFFYQSKENINHTKKARLSVVQILRKLNNKIDKIPQSKNKAPVVINQKIVNYKKKKYLKILKSDITKIATQPNYLYLEITK